MTKYFMSEFMTVGDLRDILAKLDQKAIILLEGCDCTGVMDGSSGINIIEGFVEFVRHPDFIDGGYPNLEDIIPDFPPPEVELPPQTFVINEEEKGGE